MIKQIQTIEKDIKVVRYEMEKTSDGWIGIITTTTDGENKESIFIQPSEWIEFWTNFNSGTHLDETVKSKLQVEGEIGEETEDEYLNM